MARPTDGGETEFLNVDLEVFSRERLAPLVEALGPSVHVLHEGRWGRRYAACLEVSGSYRLSADAIIRRMVRLLTKMPRSARVLWNRAQTRQFNVGIEAAARSRTFELPLGPETLRAAARVGAQLVVTVYAPERVPGPQAKPSKKRRSRPTRS